MVSGVKLLLDQHNLVFVEGQDLHIYDLTGQKEVQVFKNVEPSVGGYQYDQLNNRVLIFQGRGNLYGLDLVGSGGAEPLLNPIEQLGGVIDAIKLYRDEGAVMAIISIGGRIVRYDLKNNSFEPIYSSSELHTVHAISETSDNQHFLIGENGKINFLNKQTWSSDREIEVTILHKGANVAEQILQVEESYDSKHLIVRVTEDIVIINIETGKEVKRIPGGKQFFQSPESGDLSVNTDRGIELWSFNQKLSGTPKEITVRDGVVLSKLKKFTENALELVRKRLEGISKKRSNKV
jgi:hypothetical protein